MARQAMDRADLDPYTVVEVTHPSSTPKRPRVYRYLVVLTTAGATLFGCQCCTNVYSSRDALRRHIRRDHTDGKKIVDAAAPAGTVAPEPAREPVELASAADPGTEDLGDLVQQYATELATEAAAWRSRALSAERRLEAITGALSAPTTALPVIGREREEGADGG